MTASLGANLFDNRGYWRGAIQNGPDLPTAVTASTKYETASLDPTSTGTTALAYAAETGACETDAQPRPMARARCSNRRSRRSAGAGQHDGRGEAGTAGGERRTADQ